LSRFIKQESPYAIVPNIALWDKQLKMTSRFLWAFLCNLPDNWNHSVVGLASAVGCGEKAIRTAIKELEYHGYLKRVQQREANKFAGYDYLLIANPKSQESVQKSSAYQGNDADRAIAIKGDDNTYTHNKITNNSNKQIKKSNNKQRESYQNNTDVNNGSFHEEKVTVDANSIKERCPEGYKLCNEIGIEISVAADIYSSMSQEIFMKYLKYTANAVKHNRIHNPTGFFIDATKKQYNIQPCSKTGDVPAEIIKQTERDMQEQFERELATAPPVSPDSPFYKFYSRYAANDVSP